MHKFVQRHGPTMSSRPTMFGAAKRPVPMQCSGSGCLFFCDEDRVLLDTSQCLLDIPEFVERHGPAMSSKPTMFGAAIDLVPAIRCRTFPECAQKWITRKRHPGWSGSDLINMCKSLGCFFVRVGHPNSPEMDSQWRISFSLQERLFVTHFNSTQLHCYVLLKLIKKEIIVRLLQAESITSYHCKTCMLYMIENTPASFWTEENLLVCLHNCLKLILQWVKEGICPNYFIPEENMFDGRVNDIVRSRLCRVLTDLISAHFGFLLSINSDQFGLRLDSMLKGTMLSKEYLWNYLNFMKTTLVLGTVHHALALHVCIMDQIKENDSHTALNGTLSRMMEFKQHTDNGTEHTFEETTKALSLTEPYVEMSLMSMTIAYVNSTQGSTKTTYNAMISDRWNEIGSTSDAFSAKLKQACLLHMSGYSVVSLDLLLSLESKMNSKVVSICRCSSDESHFPSRVGSLEDLEFGSAEELLRQHLVPCVQFVLAEQALTPIAICYEMMRSTKVEDLKIPAWRFERASVDGKILLYFLLYLNHSELEMEANAQSDIDNIHTVIETDPVLGHKETALNILGFIYKEKGCIDKAVRYFSASLVSQPENNAASLYMHEIRRYIIKLIDTQ